MQLIRMYPRLQGFLDCHSLTAKALFAAASGSVADKRKMHQAAGDKVNTLITEIRMYEKAIAIVGENVFKCLIGPTVLLRLSIGRPKAEKPKF